MNVTLEKTDNVEGVIRASVDKADYVDKVKKELNRISKTHVIPGFRKGHVPMDQLRRRFGKEVKSEVINDLVFREVIKYIQDNKVEILGEPLPKEVTEIPLEDGDYTFAYEVGFAPAIEVKVDKDTTLPYYTIEVSDEMREQQDKALCERLGSQVPGDTVDDRALVKGVIMELNEDGSVKESEDAIQVVNGIVAPFYFKDKDEEAKFIGKHVDDKVVFNPWKTCEGNPAELSSMLNIDKDKTADVKGDFQMTISEIIVAKPAEHNQDFYDNVFGKDKVHNEEEYKTALTEMIARSLADNSRSLFAAQTHEYYLEKFKDLQLPDAFLKRWLMARNEELTEANIEEEYAKMRPSLIWQLVKDEISKNLDIKVEEEDLTALAKSITYQQFAQYGMTNMDETVISDYAKRMLENKEYRQRIHDNVSENKVFAVIEDNVTLDNKTVSLDEFKAIAKKD